MSSFDELMELEDKQIDGDESGKTVWELKNTKEIFKWLKDEYEYLMKENRERHTVMMENLAIYKGVQFEPNNSKTLNDFIDTSKIKSNNREEKLLVNHLYDITETIVSRASRNKPQPEVVPANSDQEHDRNAAKSVSQILNYITYINDLPIELIHNKRHSLLTGVGYMTVRWNPDIGDIHPAWAMARENNFMEVDDLGQLLIDEEGNPIPVVGPNGKKLNDKQPIRVGEVEILRKDAWRILLENKDQFKDVDYYFETEIVKTAELKKDYPAKAREIKSIDNQKIFDSEQMAFRKVRNETIKITFYHRKTKYLPEGMEAVFTMDVLLDKSDARYDHNDLDLIPLTDIDLVGELHPESFFEQVKALQWRHNQMSSDIITNQRLCAKPKWIVPKGRVKIEALGNDITIVQYSGQIPPKLQSASPTPAEVFNFRRELKEELEQISTVTGTARRDPPTGATASVTLRFLTELEAERVSVAVTKQNEFVKNIYKRSMSVAGTFYDESDGRTMRVLGNDQQFYIKDLKVSNLNKAYDVIIRNIGALPETRAAKEARIFDVLQSKPNLLSDVQLIEALDLGSLEKVTTILTESLRSAENENERFFSEGEFVLEPAPYEDHITHWKTHVQKLQSLAIKENADAQDRTDLEEHIFGTEFLMIDKAKVNPTFNAELANLKLFPIFFRGGSFTPSSKDQQKAVVQGQANRGDELTEQIGGDPSENESIQPKEDMLIPSKPANIRTGSK